MVSGAIHMRYGIVTRAALACPQKLQQANGD